jgi:hypothetical protein
MQTRHDHGELVAAEPGDLGCERSQRRTDLILPLPAAGAQA